MPTDPAGGTRCPASTPAGHRQPRRFAASALGGRDERVEAHDRDRQLDAQGERIDGHRSERRARLPRRARWRSGRGRTARSSIPSVGHLRAGTGGRARSRSPWRRRPRPRWPPPRRLAHRRATANAIDGATDSNITLKLVETIARWRIRMAGCHAPPGGTSVAVTAVNPATATAINAIVSRSASPGMPRSLSQGRRGLGSAPDRSHLSIVDSLLTTVVRGHQVGDKGSCPRLAPTRILWSSRRGSAPDREIASTGSGTGAVVSHRRVGRSSFGTFPSAAGGPCRARSVVARSRSRGAAAGPHRPGDDQPSSPSVTSRRAACALACAASSAGATTPPSTAPAAAAACSRVA